MQILCNIVCLKEVCGKIVYYNYCLKEWFPIAHVHFFMVFQLVFSLLIAFSASLQSQNKVHCLGPQDAMISLKAKSHHNF